MADLNELARYEADYGHKKPNKSEGEISKAANGEEEEKDEYAGKFAMVHADGGKQIRVPLSVLVRFMQARDANFRLEREDIR